MLPLSAESAASLAAFIAASPPTGSLADLPEFGSLADFPEFAGSSKSLNLSIDINDLWTQLTGERDRERGGDEREREREREGLILYVF